MPRCGSREHTNCRTNNEKMRVPSEAHENISPEQLDRKHHGPTSIGSMRHIPSLLTLKPKLQRLAHIKHLQRRASTRACVLNLQRVLQCIQSSRNLEKYDCSLIFEWSIFSLSNTLSVILAENKHYMVGRNTHIKST